jgi:ribonuclease P protein component
LTPSGNTLSKDERLSSKVAISALMKGGRHGAAGPLRYCFAVRPEGGRNRFMVSVPKRNFKRAVKRNLLKRRIRESYRLRKGLLPPVGADLLLVYLPKTILPFSDIYSAVGDVLSEVAALTEGKK